MIKALSDKFYYTIGYINKSLDGIQYYFRNGCPNAGELIINGVSRSSLEVFLFPQVKLHFGQDTFASSITRDISQLPILIFYNCWNNFSSYEYKFKIGGKDYMEYDSILVIGQTIKTFLKGSIIGLKYVYLGGEISDGKLQTTGIIANFFADISTKIFVTMSDEKQRNSDTKNLSIWDFFMKQDDLFQKWCVSAKAAMISFALAYVVNISFLKLKNGFIHEKFPSQEKYIEFSKMLVIHSTDFIIQGIIARGVFDYFTKSQKTNAEFQKHELANDRNTIIDKIRQDVCVDNEKCLDKAEAIARSVMTDATGRVLYVKVDSIKSEEIEKVQPITWGEFLASFFYSFSMAEKLDYEIRSHRQGNEMRLLKFEAYVENNCINAALMLDENYAPLQTENISQECISTV
jgi:hypothetical protein